MDINTLTLSPICSVLDGTEDMCEGLSICEGCGDHICPDHSDKQATDGRTDPMRDAWGDLMHRECYNNKFI